jgi:hypothetical protein
MTENELELLRLRCRLLAHEAVLGAVCSALARTFPSFGQSLLESGISAKVEYQTLALKGARPEVSDMIAAEFQEAFDEVLSFITKDRGSNPQ